MVSICTFDVSKESLPDFLLYIQQGKIQLPDLQRSFCWEDSLVREIIASASLGWPVGAIMLLQLGNPEVKFRPRLVEGVTLNPSPSPDKLILDGQQRSTSLFQSLFSNRPVIIKDKTGYKTQSRWYYIDIEKALNPDIEREDAIISLPESRRKSGFAGLIDCSTPEKEYSSGLFPVSQTFQFSTWRSHYQKHGKYHPDKLELIDRFEAQIIKQFERYQIPIILLRPELPKQGVCRIFEKINTIGTPLNFFDLATAIYASDDFSLRADWEKRRARLNRFKVLSQVRNIDFLQSVTLVATYNRLLKALTKGIGASEKPPGVGCSRVEVLKLSLEDYQQWVEPVTKAYEEAVRWLHGQKIYDAADLAYPIQLVALTAILTVIGDKTNNDGIRLKLEQWWWTGACCNRYTGAHEYRAAKDIQEVPDWLMNGGVVPSLITESHFNVIQLRKVRRKHGSLYKSLGALLRRNGAIDFATGEALSDVRFFDGPLESHHIFPVAYCRQHDIPAAEYNSLINRTPLSKATNRIIGGKAPSKYLAKLEQQGISRRRLDEILRSHLIEPETLWDDDFEAFYAARTEALTRAVLKAMGC